MKHILLIICLFISYFGFSQEEKKAVNSFVDINYFRGNIPLHNRSILHLIQGHPDGIILSWSKKTFGHKEWEQYYNYPDYGASLSYQRYGNTVLGENYGLYAHYNFYFLHRNLMLRIAQGLAYNTNPYDKYTNHKNTAFGSTILSSTYVMINYKKERLFDRFGLQAGLSLTHYSNANFKAPNNSVNTIAFNLGVLYNLDDEDMSYAEVKAKENVTEPIRFNFAFRSGVNESDVVGSGQFPFYIISCYADKRLSRKSALQLGADAFFSEFLKALIHYRSIAYPEEQIDRNTDHRRVGIFVGHELFVNKMSLLTQFGYYVHYPFDFEGRTYQRIGLKRYFGDKVFAAITLKTHAAKAEALELGIGIRL
ncbi:MAG: acyloxyacyl hydrolase [Flavobacteriaceae bacterium]|nr:acyloxyacyl hydrolase [Flavobacteriaceae bacterium]